MSRAGGRGRNKPKKVPEGRGNISYYTRAQKLSKMAEGTPGMDDVADTTSEGGIAVPMSEDPTQPKYWTQLIKWQPSLINA